MNTVALTYELAHDAEHRRLMTARSALTGETINRFCHLHQSTDDLINKVRMQRLLGQRCGTCFQRCVGLDALNAVFATTFDMDRKLGTSYHARFRKFAIAMERNDWIVDGAMTDVKGDRGKRPAEQKDRDMYLRVVERRADGVLIRGAKAHQTGAVNSHMVLVMPTVSLKSDEKDYAIVAALPSDTDGITYIYGRQSCDERKLGGGEASDIDAGSPTYGGQEALMIFEDVFVPNDMLFMNGETEFAGLLVDRFASYHRQSYGGCKVGNGDVAIGAAASIAECNGVARASHIKDKIVEMNHLNETLFACGIACSANGKKLAAGNYFVDALPCQCMQAERDAHALRDRAHPAGHRRRPDGHAALGQGLAQPGDRRDPEEVPCRRRRHEHLRARAAAAPDREPHHGARRCGLSHRVHARRRIAAGAARAYQPPGECRREEGVREKPRAQQQPGDGGGRDTRGAAESSRARQGHIGSACRASLSTAA